MFSHARIQQRRDVSRTGEVVLAGSLSLVGLSIAGLRALANPASKLSRWLDSLVVAVGPR